MLPVRRKSLGHMSNSGRNEVVAILDVDPDLREGLSDEQLAAARATAYASSRCFPRGNWRAPTELDRVGSLGLLVLKGFVVRNLAVAEYTCTELLGPGDVLQPWLPTEHEQAIGVRVEWTVVQRLCVAILDRSFAVSISSWPEITAAVSRRMAWRAHLLAFQLALSALRRIDERVLLMLWQLASRWGTVTPEGILLDVPLTHDLLAAAVGARRPSVSAAVGRLIDAGKLQSRPRSRWMLLGAPPSGAQASR